MLEYYKYCIEIQQFEGNMIKIRSEYTDSNKYVLYKIESCKRKKYAMEYLTI